MGVRGAAWPDGRKGVLEVELKDVLVISERFGFTASALANAERHTKIASELGTIEELLGVIAGVPVSAGTDQDELRVEARMALSLISR